MGYILENETEKGDEVLLNVRENWIPTKITTLPFVKHNYYRGKK